MADKHLPGDCYHDKFRTVGALRAAAFELSCALDGMPQKQLAKELHDSIVRFLPGPGEVTAGEVRFMMGDPA